MLKIADSRNIWLSSDTHYGHKNICRGVTDWRMPDESLPIHSTRDFNTIEEMNDAIVNNINEVVKKGDVLVHLGDWSFGGRDNVEIFRDRIICDEIHLTLGNHDHHIERNKGDIQNLFASVQDFLRLKYNKRHYEMMHYPLTTWNNLRRGRIHLHGHCHLPDNRKISGGRRIDVGMDGHPEFRPYNLMDELYEIMRDIPVGSEMGEDDHHLNNVQNIVG